MLAEIVAAKRAEVVARRQRVSEDQLLRDAKHRVPRSFEAALTRGGRGIIAELKQASPSRGVLRKNYDPPAIARAYEEAGARAISVLTDGKYFQGMIEHLQQAREATLLPVLRKDFIVDPYQVAEAAAAGADAILLIVAALERAEMQEVLNCAIQTGLDVLVEVHSEDEIEEAVALGAQIIGINNRNLSTLEVNVEVSLRLISKLPPGALAVSESGLKTLQDLDRLEAAGFRAFLIGEHFMTSDDPGVALRAFLPRVGTG